MGTRDRRKERIDEERRDGVGKNPNLKESTNTEGQKSTLQRDAGELDSETQEEVERLGRKEIAT